MSRPRSEAADLSLQPGDVLCIRGRGELHAVGRSGGFLGHVLVVTEHPTRVFQHTVDGLELESVWPSPDAVVWKVPTLESTRGRAGLHRAEMILHSDPRSGRLLLIAEMVPISQSSVELSTIHDEFAELWHCPAELRASMQPHLFEQAVADMYEADAAWSYATAARAALRSAVLPDMASTALVDLVQSSWISPPICTSVIVAVWQRYLCKLALSSGGDDMAASLLRRWMPLLADRVLPGELLQILQAHGWRVSHSLEPFQLRAMTPMTAPVTPRGVSAQVVPQHSQRDPCADLDFRAICNASSMADCIQEPEQYELLEGARPSRLRRLTCC